MDETLKKIECSPTCGFMVRSHVEKEVLEMAAEHMQKIHHKTVSTSDLKSELKAA